MEPIIYEFQEIKIIGIGNIGEPVNPADVWPVLFTRIEEVPDRKNSHETLGVIKRNEHGYLAGVQVEELNAVPEGMSSYIIPAGRYASMTHKGPLSKINETFETIISWLSVMNHEQYDIVCFEVYDDRFKGEDEDSEFDMYIQMK
ncbi:GyrI-like domain-containing protein [Paenibacillus marinisediminis]